MGTYSRALRRMLALAAIAGALWMGIPLDPPV
jgi:hypothetical protein